MFCGAIIWHQAHHQTFRLSSDCRTQATSSAKPSSLRFAWQCAGAHGAHCHQGKHSQQNASSQSTTLCFTCRFPHSGAISARCSLVDGPDSNGALRFLILVSTLLQLICKLKLQQSWLDQFKAICKRDRHENNQIFVGNLQRTLL